MSIYYPYEVFVGSDVVSFSFEVPDALVCVFTEADRVSGLPEEEQGEEYLAPNRYEAPVKIIRDRLEIMGYTSARWKAELEDFRAQCLDDFQKQIDRDRELGVSTVAMGRIARVVELSKPERWVNTLTSMFADQWGWSGNDWKSPALKKAMTDGEYGPIQVPFTNERCLLRAVIDQHDDSDVVQFEFGNATLNDDVDPETPFTLQAASALLGVARAVEKIIVLTEGKTDSRILSRSFERLYPHLDHMFTFLDHAAFKAAGGVSELERLAKGLASAGVSNRTVVLFDNDTAGISGAQRLRQVGLPSNFRIVILPELDTAKSYPTLGPTGPALADINGSACCIELYCGPSALMGENDEPCPIQWTGYDAAMKRYQGEPLDKEKIKERFFQILDRSIDPMNDVELASVNLILQAIMRIEWS